MMLGIQINPPNPFVAMLLRGGLRVQLYGRMGEVVPGRGYLPTKDAILIPARFPLLTHELAHMIEVRDTSRLLRPDMGMRVFGRIRKTNPLYRASTPGFFAGMARETRVRAIESVLGGTVATSLLAGHGGISGWARDAVERLPFGRFRTLTDVSDWTAAISRATLRDWNRDRCWHEWIRRIEYLRGWMETRQAA